MKIGITGGTGFVGSRLARRVVAEGHEAVLVSRGRRSRPPAVTDRPDASFVAASVADERALRRAFDDCDRVAHLAGINVERNDQTYDAVHVTGTRNVVAAAEDAGVSKVLLSSYLKARPDGPSAYHTSKWAAEEAVRNAGLDYTVLKQGITYGPGDHMLEHVSRVLATLPVFGLIGCTERRLRPLAVEDLVDIAAASLLDDRLTETTVGVVGPDELTLREVVSSVADALSVDPVLIPLPVGVHHVLGWVQERAMEVPITTVAQVRMLTEGACEPAPRSVCETVPADLAPTAAFSAERIRNSLSDPRPYGIGDLRF